MSRRKPGEPTSPASGEERTQPRGPIEGLFLLPPALRELEQGSKLPRIERAGEGAPMNPVTGPLRLHPHNSNVYTLRRVTLTD